LLLTRRWVTSATGRKPFRNPRIRQFNANMKCPRIFGKKSEPKKFAKYPLPDIKDYTVQSL
jgi:hypothetical protein